MKRMNLDIMSALIGIDDPDTPIFRTFPFYRFKELLSDNKIVLVTPSLWEDPFENLLTSYSLIDKSKSPWQELHFDNIRSPVFGQCWSFARESDALWRIYSKVDKNPDSGRNRTGAVPYEGIKVRSTARKLLTCLEAAAGSAQMQNHLFLGRVSYLPETEALQSVANLIGKQGPSAFGGTRGHAEALLIKRDSFDHEQEARLIFVPALEAIPSEKVQSLPVEAAHFIEEVILDPRICDEDSRARKKELLDLGYTGLISKSDLYQRRLIEVIINEAK